MIGMMAMLGAGAQAGGGIANFMESRRRADIIGTQKKLAVRQSGKRQRRAVAAQSGRAAGAGVMMAGTTLDRLNQTNYEFELDQEIIKESARLEQDAIERQGIQDLIGGFIGAGGQMTTATPQPSKLTKIKKPVTTTSNTMPGFGMPWAPMGAVR